MKKCPVCNRELQEDLRSGVMADICPDHGIWLDKGELEKILAPKVRRRIRLVQGMVNAAEERGRRQARFHGWWWLLR